MTRLDDIRARAEKATEGPWTGFPTEDVAGAMIFGGDGTTVAEGFWDNKSPEPIRRMRTEEACNANVDFIAHAREDIPYLLSELDACAEALACAKSYRAITRHLAHYNPELVAMKNDIGKNLDEALKRRGR